MGSFKSLVLLAMVCVQLQMIASMTNYEFYQAVKPYIDDENVEYRGRAVADDDDVIYLPGGPNDEFDVEYVLERMGLLEIINDKSDEESRLNPLQRLGLHAGCKCQTSSCECSLSHTFSFFFTKFTLKASVTVTYSAGTFTLTFALNDHRLFSHAVNLKHMPALCYGVPGLSIAKVCLDLYGLDMAQRKICAKVVGKLDIKVHEFKVNLDLGCVKIPILKDADSLYLGQAGADDVDMPYADVTKPADRLMSLFVTELWKSLNNLDN
ncbi:uncharacterized protein LOC128221189 [Mya arenaria]|uniref:uncharacterized protein LOC128221189 n=1 Tax=Mya arenaria TaxID=6604 RepID=UPI0022E058EC|nr:uncharacterized protein LOC128221189 [Mya arenaria]